MLVVNYNSVSYGPDGYIEKQTISESTYKAQRYMDKKVGYILDRDGYIVHVLPGIRVSVYTPEVLEKIF